MPRDHLIDHGMFDFGPLNTPSEPDSALQTIPRKHATVVSEPSSRESAGFIEGRTDAAITHVQAHRGLLLPALI